MGGARERVCGSCICVQISWQIFFFPLLFLSPSFFFHSGRFLHQVAGKAAFCHETLQCALCMVEGWREEGGGDKLERWRKAGGFGGQ